METSRIDNQVPFMATHPTEIIKDEIKERGIGRTLGNASLQR